MQVLQPDRLLRDVHRSRQLVNNLDERNHFSLCNIENQSHQGNDAKFLKLKWRKLERLACQVGGARNIFCEIYGDHKAKNTFWLDSSSVEKVCFLFKDILLYLN